MPLFFEQLLVVVLTVNVDEKGGDFAQQRGRNGFGVDAGGGFSFGGDLSGKIQNAVFIGRQIIVLQPTTGRFGQVGKHSLHKRIRFAGAYQFFGNARAAQNADRVDDDAFAGTGFTGKRRKALRKRQIQAFD